MSREIKFRAWIFKNKIYDDVMVGNGNVLAKINGDWVKISEAISCKVMEYTGLKDKNGKEIYEGDILLYSNSYKTIVNYKNGAFVRSYENSNMYLLYDSFIEDCCLIDYEVIGNIYENPELLEDGI